MEFSIKFKTDAIHAMDRALPLGSTSETTGASNTHCLRASNGLLMNFFALIVNLPSDIARKGDSLEPNAFNCMETSLLTRFLNTNNRKLDETYTISTKMILV